MGNKIGFEIDNELFKLVYAQYDQQNINFIINLNSKYLQKTSKLHGMTIFMFQCEIGDILQYQKSQNVQILRQHYRDLLTIQQLTLKTNRQTIHFIQNNLNIRKALEDILLTKFVFSHQSRAHTVLSLLNSMYEHKLQCFYHFNTFPITELVNFQEKNQLVIHNNLSIPQNYLLVSLRNGITFYSVRNKETEKSNGSIIGEKTLLGILKMKFPKKSFKKYISQAFSKGRLKKTDLLVSDIYGNSSNNLGLPHDLLASSMGKIGKMNTQQLNNLSESDVVRSLITSLCVHIALHIKIKLQKQMLQNVVILADQMDNQILYWVMQSVICHYIKDAKVLFCKFGPYMSCIGMAL